MLYASKISEIYNINNDDVINVYVTQKKNVNQQPDKTKDGIHFIFTIKMHKAAQVIIRNKLLKELGVMWDDIQYTNTVEDIIDEGVVKGHVNWQLYGSQKPNNEPYCLTNYFTLKYDASSDYWNLKEENLSKIKIIDHLKFMSARYDKHISFELKSEYNEEFESQKKNLNMKDQKAKPIVIKNKINLVGYDYSKITNKKILDELIEDQFDNIRHIDYELKETHEFTMILPEKYYGESSYNKWIRVGWALKNTDDKMFLTWMQMSSQYKNFSFLDIPKYYDMWKTFEQNNQDGLTNRSIMYWAKLDNPYEYQKNS